MDKPILQTLYVIVFFIITFGVYYYISSTFVKVSDVDNIIKTAYTAGSNKDGAFVTLPGNTVLNYGTFTQSPQPSYSSSTGSNVNNVRITSGNVIFAQKYTVPPSYIDFRAQSDGFGDYETISYQVGSVHPEGFEYSIVTPPSGLPEVTVNWTALS